MIILVALQQDRKKDRWMDEDTSIYMSKVIEYRSGTYEGVQMRHVLYIQLFVSLVTRRDVQFSNIIVL